MTARKGATRSSNARHNRCDQLKDEVYRHMFRLEANRPGADIDLATALLRGWLASCSEPDVLKLREWLKKVCPVCLLMIQAGRQASDPDHLCVQ
ncbi:MAG TPA: hypothetical protein VF865_09845 [Acidobacteriaceae bacterium]